VRLATVVVGSAAALLLLRTERLDSPWVIVVQPSELGISCRLTRPRLRWLLMAPDASFVLGEDGRCGR
jgi:hypothetical protein